MKNIARAQNNSAKIYLSFYTFQNNINIWSHFERTLSIKLRIKYTLRTHWVRERKMNFKSKYFIPDRSKRTHDVSILIGQPHQWMLSHCLSGFVANEWHQRFDIFRERTQRSELFVRAMRCHASVGRNLSTARDAETKAHTKNGVKRTVTISVLNVVLRVCVAAAHVLSTTVLQTRKQCFKRKSNENTRLRLSHRSISLSWTSSRMDVYWILSVGRLSYVCECVCISVSHTHSFYSSFTSFPISH